MNPNYTTDGPWSSDSEFISSPDGFIAQVVERDTPRETEANGRLIASAPDLLSALERLAHPMADDDDLDYAREIIAKAKGQQP
jgi:hypothetical protein